VRGCYTAMATAHMLGLDKQKLAEGAGMLQYVRRCQVVPLNPKPYTFSAPRSDLAHNGLAPRFQLAGCLMYLLYFGSLVALPIPLRRLWKKKLSHHRTSHLASQPRRDSNSSTGSFTVHCSGSAVDVFEVVPGKGGK